MWHYKDQEITSKVSDYFNTVEPRYSGHHLYHKLVSTIEGGFFQRKWPYLCIICCPNDVSYKEATRVRYRGWPLYLQDCFRLKVEMLIIKLDYVHYFSKHTSYELMKNISKWFAFREWLLTIVGLQSTLIHFFFL